MSRKFREFIEDSKPLTDKNKAIKNFIFTNLNRLQSMFEYQGLPETIDARWLEYYLMVNGYAFVTKVDGDLYAFTGGLGGPQDAYYQDTRIVISNPALNFNKDCEIGKDGILIRNDTMMEGMLPLLRKYGSLLVESDLTIRCALINLRIYNTISASDDNTAKSATEYLNNIEDGKLGIIAEGAFFEGVKIQNNANSTGYLSQLIQMTQYIKASFFNEIGLNANYNLKREYISVTENSLADDIILPLAHTMLRERKKAVEKINEMFGTNIEVEFNSAWLANDTENEKEIANNDNQIHTVDDLNDSTSNNELGGDLDESQEVENTVESDQNSDTTDTQVDDNSEKTDDEDSDENKDEKDDESEDDEEDKKDET